MAPKRRVFAFAARKPALEPVEIAQWMRTGIAESFFGYFYTMLYKIMENHNEQE